MRHDFEHKAEARRATADTRDRCGEPLGPATDEGEERGAIAQSGGQEGSDAIRVVRGKTQ